MAALQVHAVPGLTVSTAATATATDFLLPLILGLSSIGFIFSAVIALSPTAAEIVEEDELMRRIGQSQATRHEPQAPYQPQARYQPGQARTTLDQEADAGSLFRPQRPQRRDQN
jgi:hypothetical protein